MWFVAASVITSFGPWQGHKMRNVTERDLFKRPNGSWVFGYDVYRWTTGKKKYFWSPLVFRDTFCAGFCNFSPKIERFSSIQGQGRGLSVFRSSWHESGFISEQIGPNLKKIVTIMNAWGSFSWERLREIYMGRSPGLVRLQVRQQLIRWWENYETRSSSYRTHEPTA